ncbi:mismatch-specific DNA-glycosylase [Pseudoroseomonas ludipueritiae]|uniref:Mismatch-specific DNA-glycosylase n=1 Tax=Pseudoroseomonas ludipueritiae TaxID=198093 RepID=A0ABR7R0Y9_9PROT|nr:mismatch-specific DNA-glycosylase [Pseudoroseomonas ludipueritiae]MBC9175405.1 mismatch-specific DNA-glycosylase [Pseudoroseomonas ludipueritiae]
MKQPVLPDLLRPGLRLVFCGSAPGAVSAARGAYYAHPGNRFWRVLHEAGLTPRRLSPHEYPLLLGLGIGLTDMAKHASGNDADLPPDAYDPEGFRQRILAVEPAAVAFTAKAPAAAFLGRRTGALPYGRVEGLLGFPAIWVMPSTSGQASRFWDDRPWHALGAWFRGAAPG